MKQDKSYTVDAVIVCKEDMICDCGGVFECEGSPLLTNPVKYEVRYPFCGNISYVFEPNVSVSFKVKDNN